MKFIPYITLIAAAMTLFSCAAAWRGDGPPSTLVNSIWIGTNDARGEIIEMRFGYDGGGGSASQSGQASENNHEEKGTMIMIFSKPSDAGERDSILYTGTYVYKYHNANDGTGNIRGSVSMSLVEKDSGEPVSASMSYHNQRFYLTFQGSAYPTDPA